MAHDTATPPLYTVESLQDFSALLLRRAGLTDDKAMSVASTLIEGDLMGHSTHGLALLAPYLGALDKGDMTRDGNPEVVADHGGAVTWDGRYLPGPWLTHSAIDLALERVATHKVVTVVIRRSSHIGCLAAYPKRATDRGLIMQLACSDPSVVSVAPFGSVEPAYTPNPLAFGWPTDGDPVIVDISASTTTNGMTGRLYQQKKTLGGPWLIDGHGAASNDPAVLFNDPKGAILPLGGRDLGHKGFGLGLLVEALTAGLGGYGRADKPTRWGASVFLQVMDPAAFGGRDAFVRETSWFAERCRTAAVPPGKPPVRLPGERALKRSAEQRRGRGPAPRHHPGLAPLGREVRRPAAGHDGITMPIQAINTQRLYQQAADQIATLIRAGEYAAGGRLPAERDLAKQLGVSRPTVREALIALEIAGLIEVRTGSGAYIKPLPADGATNGGPTDTGPSPFELIGARRLVEPPVAALAAQTIADSELAGILEAIELSERRRNGTHWEKLDADRLFHERIARSTHNAVVIDIVEGLWKGMFGPIFAVLSERTQLTHQQGMTVDDHRAIYGCLERHDASGAHAAMLAHLVHVEITLLKADEALNGRRST